MPATVKSLEERIDDIADEMGDMKVSLATLAGGQSAVQSQVTALVGGQSALQSQMTALAANHSALQSQMAALAGNQSTMQGQLAALINGQATTQAQLAVLTVKLEGATDGLATANARQEATTQRLDALITDHVAVKAKAETTFGPMRWAGATGTGVLVTVVFMAFALLRAAGSVEATIQQHQKTLDEIKHELSDLRLKLK